MKITDKEVIKLMKRANSIDLTDSIESYSEEERNGRSDLQFFADELSWIISKYESSGWSQNEYLRDSRRILRDTKNGKQIPLWDDLTPMYKDWEVREAKESVSEYNRLKRLQKKVEGMGVFGQWR